MAGKPPGEGRLKGGRDHRPSPSLGQDCAAVGAGTGPAGSPRRACNGLSHPRLHTLLGDPIKSVPARTTTAGLLRREDLAQPRPAPRRILPHQEPLAHAAASNDVWRAEFKGWFLAGDGQRCDPVTLTDAHSRFLLPCRAVPKTNGPNCPNSSTPPSASPASRRHPRRRRPALRLHRPGRPQPRPPSPATQNCKPCEWTEL
jgi:hypothetical protein